MQTLRQLGITSAEYYSIVRSYDPSILRLDLTASQINFEVEISV